jgi:hypothetical protein
MLRGGGGVVGVSEVFSNFRVRESRLTESGVGALTVGSDVQAFAGRVVEIGGKFAFPEIGIVICGHTYLCLYRGEILVFGRQGTSPAVCVNLRLILSACV